MSAPNRRVAPVSHASSADAIRRAYAWTRRRQPVDPVGALVAGGMAVAGALLAAGVVADAARPEDVAEGLLLRVALVLVGAMGLAVHGSVLRGPARAVWGLLPVDAAEVVAAELRGVARTGVAATAFGWAALAPLWWAAPDLVIPGGLVLASAVVAAIPASCLALLGAVAVAEDPAWAGPLDAVRGANPRAQAALIYALAPVVLGLGGLCAWASAGALRLAGGDPAGAAGLVALWLAAAALGRRVPEAARVGWFPATMVLSEIRARYAALEDPREAGHVALDWTLRWLPARVARHAAIDLRYGWRERRGGLMVGWAVALAAVPIAWSASERAWWLGGALAGAAAWLGVWVVTQRRAITAPSLRILLADPAAEAAARAWCVAGWATGPVALLAGLVVLDAGPWAGVVALAAGLGHAAVAGACAAVVPWAAT